MDILCALNCPLWKVFGYILLLEQARKPVVILSAQLWVLVKAYIKYRKTTFLKRDLLELTVPQIGFGKKELKESTDEEINQEFQKFNLANWLYEDLIVSLFGLFVSFIGITMQF